MNKILMLSLVVTYLLSPAKIGGIAGYIKIKNVHTEKPATNKKPITVTVKTTNIVSKNSVAHQTIQPGEERTFHPTQSIGDFIDEIIVEFDQHTIAPKTYKLSVREKNLFADIVIHLNAEKIEEYAKAPRHKKPTSNGLWIEQGDIEGGRPGEYRLR